MLEPLVDGHGRRIADLRVSVTDRCNFRCQYCMPAEGLPWLEREAVLSFEEIERLVGLLASMGVSDVRLTGGEPLVRREFPRLVAMLAPLVKDLSVTTNGFLLERDAEALVRAGVTRFNVSIDSLQRDRFYEMTRRDALPRVLRGLEVLAGYPEAHPIKINAVAMRGFTEDEVLPFARFAREHPYEVRFIEFMPLDADHAWTPESVLTGAEIRALVEDLSVTTNGFLLERDAEALVDAGVTRFNVSIDSLQRDRFYEMTRRDALPRVLRGLEVLGSFPEAHPIKVNAVAMRGFTEDEVLPFARFAREHPYEVRFIEFMPLDADHAWTPDAVLTGAEVRAAIEEQFPLEPTPREPHATARVYRFADGHGSIGFINPVSEPFCGDCNRIRLTADGKLRTCLFSLNETDLRAPLREGASDADLEEIVRAAVWRKELKHHVNEPGFVQPARTMSAIGG
jgi:cyclic pyranopterin phosphate synthase